jgi:hypothetical protein
VVVDRRVRAACSFGRAATDLVVSADRERDRPSPARRRARRSPPKDFPPWPTVYRWFAWLGDDGAFERINHALVMQDRQRVGREASPGAAMTRERRSRDASAMRWSMPTAGR